MLCTKKIVFLFSLFFFAQYTLSQQAMLTGSVTDSLNTLLTHANIIAFPETEGEEIAFAITNEKGFYQVQLKKNIVYKIQISFIGYKELLTTIKLKEDSIKNFILEDDVTKLDNVEVTYKIPITIKEDTTTYNTDAFVNGKERKLREVLKKLPGLEVDREGNVTAMGKKITKVLVDNKPFFTGNSKIAVNNIPANVVDQIVIIDNYSEVTMLKGLQDSDEVALNVVLKKDKKRFLFGDFESGGGYKDRYVVHPNIFYYSPKTNINFIGDVNNIGEKAFTFSDYLDFEGGFGKLLNNSGIYFNLFNDSFAQFLENTNFKESSQSFGALNIRLALSNVTDISGYVISSSSKTDTETTTKYLYQNNNEQFTENRSNIANTNNFFTIGKITLDYDPNSKIDFAYNSFIKLTQNKGFGLINTETITRNNSIETINTIDALNLKQNISYSRKVNEKHTGTLEATYEYIENKPDTQWNTNNAILTSLIQLIDADDYTILQSKRVQNHAISAITKDYWVLNSHNHLYFSLGTNIFLNSFVNEDIQQLDDGNINNFSSEGFGNDINYNFFDTYVGLEYKFRIGIFTFKPAIYQHFYIWSISQNNTKNTNTKSLLLPEFNTDITLENSSKINLKYKTNARFASIDNLAENYILSNFNSIFRGNANLENELYHSASAFYSRFSLLRGIRLNATINYDKKIQQFKNETQLEGIEQFNSLIFFNLPENSWRFSGRFSKKKNKIQTKVNANHSISEFYQIINNDTNKNTSIRTTGTFGIETFFKKLPNLEIDYTKQINNYKTLNGKSKFNSDNLTAFLEYIFLEDFTFKGEYYFTNYNNPQNNSRNKFENTKLSFFYQKEDSPWGFELEAKNLFDNKFIQDNSFNTFLISDTRTFILPRIVLLKVSYKL